MAQNNNNTQSLTQAWVIIIEAVHNEGTCDDKSMTFIKKDGMNIGFICNTLFQMGMQRCVTVKINKTIVPVTAPTDHTDDLKEVVNILSWFELPAQPVKQELKDKYQAAKLKQLSLRFATDKERQPHFPILMTMLEAAFPGS
jgi:hypothetical protein